MCSIYLSFSLALTTFLITFRKTKFLSLGCVLYERENKSSDGTAGPRNTTGGFDQKSLYPHRTR